MQSEREMRSKGHKKMTSTAWRYIGEQSWSDVLLRVRIIDVAQIEEQVPSAIKTMEDKENEGLKPTKLLTILKCVHEPYFVRPTKKERQTDEE